jgi:hypothetical protein
LSHALAFAQGDQRLLTEVCTPEGMQSVSVVEITSGDETPVTGESHLDHCPYCTHGKSLHGIPATPVAARIEPVHCAAPPALYLQAPRTLFAWASAQPRAPPEAS